MQPMNTALAPSPTTPAAPEASARQAWFIGFTIDGYAKVLAPDRATAQQLFERMSLAAIAACGELWADTPKLKDELPEHEQEKIDG